VIDCSTVEFAIGLKEGSYSECECKKSYRFKARLKQCILSCEDIEYTEQLWSFPEDLVCPCVNSFVWNNTIKQCQFNCSSVVNSTGVIVEGTTDQCECLDQTKWDEVEMVCKPK
jgi:hypothetical protein